MRVGIMAGSFNPPHLGHLQVIRLARDEVKLDEVWILPLPANPFKRFVRQCAVQDKIALCQDLCAGLNWTRIFCDHDSVATGAGGFFGRFIAYIDRIKASYGAQADIELFKICGSDSFRHLLWLARVLRVLPPRHFSRLRDALAGSNFIVSPRCGSDVAIPDRIDIGWNYPAVTTRSLVDTERLKPYHQLSSRRIRSSLLNGERAIHGLDPVAETKFLACLKAS